MNINAHTGSSDPFQGSSPNPSYASANKPFYSSSGHLLPQQKIQGRYLIVEKIAEGGMGAIYLALDRRLDGKTMALKEMSEQKIPLEEREKVLKSFDQEAELLASLRHPNLTRVTDRFEEHGRHYMVMEFIEGKTLDELLGNQMEPFSEAQVLQWAAQLCEVLSFLHSQKPQPIIYRDIKPGNIMVVSDTDRVKLIDFGIARFYKRGKNKDTIPFGTEGYAPPEQYGKAQTDARSDVYALGATLHQMLTLEEPGSNLMNLPKVRKRNPDVSERVADAIDKAVKLNKEDRHQSMADMWEALSGEAPQWPHLAPTGGDEAEDALPTPSDDRVGVVDPDLQRISEPKPVYGKIIPDQTYVNLAHTFHFEPGETLRLSNSADWLTLSATKVDTQGGNITLTIETHKLQPDYLEIRGNVLQRWLGWHTSRWVMTEREYMTDITIRSKSGHKQSYPVIVHVAPTTWQQAIGWMRTLTAMLVEVGAAGGVLATLAYVAGLL
jgi:serine/threonine protein kinase